ncbi:sigma-70 family RNA polymerase sigma factor [Nocardioides dilutus]
MTGARPADARPDVPSDADLIAAVRGGDVDPYGELFARHVDAARRLARSLSSDGEADDLVSEAFAKVLVVLQRGEGPSTALRPYLLTAVRRLHVDRVRAVTRTRPTDDIAAYDAGEAFHDTAVAGFESGAAARAFASLPERWQLVLWHIEVEGHKPAEVAPLLGMSPNSVSALAYRAREGLRQAFVSMHAQDADDERCAWTRAQLGAFIRNDISKRDSAAVEAHLRDCRECAGIYLELVEVNSDLRALIAPIILGGAAAAYLGGSVGVGVAGGSGVGLLAGVGGFLGKHWGKALVGATAAGVVVAGVVVGVQAGSDDRDVAAERSTTSDPADRPAPAEGTQPEKPAPAAPAPSSDASTPGVDTEPQPGPEPGPDPVSAPSGRPDDQPDPDQPNQTDEPDEPDEPDAPDPNDDPSGDPSGDPGSAGPAGLESSAQPMAGGLVWDVAIRVTGLGAAEEGTVTVTLDRPALALHLDPRCDLVNLGSLTCHIEGPGTIRLLVTPVPGAPTVLTAVLMPGDRRSSVQLG